MSPSHASEKRPVDVDARSGPQAPFVDWEGPSDPLNPRNWSSYRKWGLSMSIVLYTLQAPMNSSFPAPALGVISQDFDISRDSEAALVISLFVLGFAVGPLLLGPLSECTPAMEHSLDLHPLANIKEAYGRIKVLQLSNLFFLVFSIVCGFAQSKVQLLTFRFLAGAGSSGPLAIGAGIIADLFPPEERGIALAIYSTGPTMGPALGATVAGFIVQYSNWRWIFWSSSVFNTILIISSYHFMRESYPPVLMARKAATLRDVTGDPRWTVSEEFEQGDEKKFWRMVVRPLTMLFTEPIVLVMSLYMAYLYGIYYLVIATFPTLFSSGKYYSTLNAMEPLLDAVEYHQLQRRRQRICQRNRTDQLTDEKISIASLHYLALGIGSFIGGQVSGPLLNKAYDTLTRQYSTKKPEYRIPPLIPGAIISPIGLLGYGWSAQYRLHWIAPDLFAGVYSMGVLLGMLCIQAYIIDAYARYAASAIAATTVLRSLLGFAMPLFAEDMYQRLGYGWGNSLLGLILVGIGIPIPFVFWKYGETLRLKSAHKATSGE